MENVWADLKFYVLHRWNFLTTTRDNKMAQSIEGLAGKKNQN